MAEDKITTLHPRGKTGRTISRAYYDTIKQAMVAVLHDHDLTHNQLFTALHAQLGASFPGNVSWYSETVKLDLEARGLITRVTTRPTTYHLV